jgi:hypothetical protein
MAACSGSAGSCLLTTSEGYDTCEDFLGTEYNSSAAQNACGQGNGTYSSGPCSTAGALGICAVGSGTADDYRYTYTPAADGGFVFPTTLESACGVAGGTFTAGP